MTDVLPALGATQEVFPGVDAANGEEMDAPTDAGPESATITKNGIGAGAVRFKTTVDSLVVKLRRPTRAV
jgi:hypothetical protein